MNFKAVLWDCKGWFNLSINTDKRDKSGELAKKVVNEVRERKSNSRYLFQVLCVCMYVCVYVYVCV